MIRRYSFPLCPHPLLGLVVNLAVAAGIELARQIGWLPPYAIVMTTVFVIVAVPFAIFCVHNPMATLEVDEDTLRFHGILRNRRVQLTDITSVHVKAQESGGNWLMTVLSRHEDRHAIMLDPRFTHHNDFEILRFLHARLQPRGIPFHFGPQASWQMRPEHWLPIET